MTRAQTWHGVFAILQTPFGSDLGVDLSQLGSEVDFCFESGADGIVYPVMASEAHTLDVQERTSAVEEITRCVRGRLPVVAGVTTSSANESVRLARHAADAGANAVICMPPRDLERTDADVLMFYDRLSASCRLPIFIQNASPPLGSPISVELVLRIVQEVQGIWYVKEEVPPSTHRISQLLRGGGDALAGVFGGRAGLQLLDELNRGSSGVFPGTAWTDFHVAIASAYQRGDRHEARRLFNRLLPALNMGMSLGTRLTKEVLVRRGVLRTTFCRDDSTELDQADLDELHAIWADLDPPRWHG
jgi:4-hydroxy-tetrahydrodipicolinate synthase